MHQRVVQHVCKSVELETSGEKKEMYMFIILIDILAIFCIVIYKLIASSCKCPKCVIDDI